VYLVTVLRLASFHFESSLLPVSRRVVLVYIPVTVTASPRVHSQSESCGVFLICSEYYTFLHEIR